MKELSKFNIDLCYHRGLEVGVAVVRGHEILTGNFVIQNGLSRFHDADPTFAFDFSTAIAKLLGNVSHFAKWAIELSELTEHPILKVTVDRAAVGMAIQPSALHVTNLLARKLLVELALAIFPLRYEKNYLPSPSCEASWRGLRVADARLALKLGYEAAMRCTKENAIDAIALERQLRSEVLAAGLLPLLPLLSPATSELIEVMYANGVTILAPQPKQDVLFRSNLGLSNTHAFDAGIKLGLMKGCRKIGVGLTPLGEQLARLMFTSPTV